MKKIVILTTLILAAVTNANIIITGIVDGYSSTPKGIELYVDGSMDLTGYTLEVCSNGGATWYTDWTFGDSSASSSGTTDSSFSNQFIYISSTLDNMIATFESATSSNTYYGYWFNGNGNDTVRLVDKDGNVVDQFGIPSQVSGSSDFSAAWCYQDSYAYRVSETGPDGDFTISNWSFGGNSYLNTSANHSADAPFGSYSIPEPVTIALLSLGSLIFVRRK